MKPMITMNETREHYASTHMIRVVSCVLTVLLMLFSVSSCGTNDGNNGSNGENQRNTDTSRLTGNGAVNTNNDNDSTNGNGDGLDVTAGNESDIQQVCSVSYASFNTAKEYADGLQVDTIVSATLGKPVDDNDSGYFKVTVKDALKGKYSSGDSFKAKYECSHGSDLIPDGYKTGDKVIVMLKDGLIPGPGAIILFNESDWDSSKTVG